ncbi:sugar dehydrogenase, partial [Halorubrum sp. Atlit-8R]
MLGSRRDFLAATGVTLLGGLAGCAGAPIDGSDGGGGSAGNDTTTKVPPEGTTTPNS